MKEVRFHASVPKEAREILGYYSTVSTSLGDSFWKELWGSIDYACAFPERHHFDATGLRRASLQRFPVHFLFKVFPKYIRITVLRHDRRNPGYGAKRH